MRHHVWGYKPAKSVLSTENLRRVSEALQSGPVFGYMYRTHSGCGPVNWLARDWPEYARVITREPASDAHLDYQVIWSLPALLERGMALAAARYADLLAGATSLFTPDDLRAIERHFGAPPRDPMREVWMVFLGTARGDEVDVEDEDNLDDIAEMAEWYCQSGGAGYVFPFTASQTRGADGLLTGTIERPEYWLLDGWYPDELGRVPVDIEYG
jgi:hypothetical protein